MENFTVLLWSAVITALAFFVVTPCVMNTVSLFGVQKTFARKMIALGILKEQDFRALHPKKTAAGSDEALRLTPPRQMSLEQCMEFLADDELLEVTPKHLRIRKRILNSQLRMKDRFGGKNRC